MVEYVGPIQHKRGTSAQWTASTIPLRDGELGIDTTIRRMKVGDGSTLWAGLPWVSPDQGTLEQLQALAAAVEGATTPTDAAMTAVGADPDSAFRAQQLATTARVTVRGAATTAIRKIRRNVEETNILVLSDSTMFYTSAAPRASRILCERVAADWPTRPVRWRQWDTGTDGWEAFTNIQTGTGANINWHNAAVSGSRQDYFFGARMAAAITDIQPDVIILNYGLNDGSSDENGAERYSRIRAMQMIETVRAAVPGATVIVSSQNERTDVVNNVGALRASRYEQACVETGAAFADVRQAFVDDPRGLSVLLTGDQLHPSATGSALIADVIYPAFEYDPTVQPREANPSGFLLAGDGLAPNGDFSSFASPPTLPGWTTANVTLSKDTSIYESRNGYSVDMAASSAAASSMYADLPIRAVAGRWVTAAARIYIPAGQSAASLGRIGIQAGDGADRTSIATLTEARNGWVWVAVEKFIPAGATFARVRIYADTASNAGANIKVDRVVAVLGRNPRGFISAQGAAGPAGPPGSATAGAPDFLSSLGNNPGVIAGAMGAGVGSASANAANLYRIKPDRNVGITTLSWVVHTTGGNYDIGLYTAAGTRLWSKGSSAVPGAGLVTESIGATIDLTAGTEYFVAIVFDGTTALARGSSIASSALMHSLTGVIQALNVPSSFPLPSTITPGSTISNRLIPITLRES